MDLELEQSPTDDPASWVYKGIIAWGGSRYGLQGLHLPESDRECCYGVQVQPLTSYFQQKVTAVESELTLMTEYRDNLATNYENLMNQKGHGKGVPDVATATPQGTDAK